MLFENYSHFSSTLSCKNNRTHSVSKQKNKCVCIHEIMRLTIIRMKMKMKNKSHRYGINRLSFKHGQKSSTYTNCRVMMMLICIKQHQSNIWNSIHAKIKQHWGWVEKKALLLKKVCKHHYTETFFIFPVFVFISRSRFIYVISVSYIFHFNLYFHYD